MNSHKLTLKRKKMLMKTKYTFLVLLGLMLSTSCNKILDINPEEYNLLADDYYKNEEQLNAALRGIYAINADPQLYGASIIGRMGLEADEGYESYSSDLASVGDYTVFATDSRILGYYRSLYRGINRANLLLENIDNKEIDINDTERNHIKGQALFLRANYYFMLVNKFGGVPLTLKATRSASTEDLQIPRSTTKQVYDAVVADLEAAADLLKPITAVPSGAAISKSAAWSMLARVCLYMAGQPLNETAKYAKAAEWAGKVMDIGFHALNASYENVFVNYAQDKYDTRESIFEIDFWGNGTGIYTNTGGTVGRNNGVAYPADSSNVGYSIGAIRSSAWLYSIYAANDLRRDWAIAPYSYTGTPRVKVNWTTGTPFQRYAGKFRRESEILLPKSTTSTPQNFPILRYADVLLMYAEGINESLGHPTAEAYEAINEVRRRAIGAAVKVPNPLADITNMSYADFKAEIKEERARELCFEALRKNDLVRWGDFYNNIKYIATLIPAGTSSYIVAARAYYSNATPRDVVWPIPVYELGVNRKLVQNVGW